MERKEFLKTLGAGAAFALAFPCIHGCSSDSNDDVAPEDMKPVPTGIDFTIDLDAAEGAGLQNNGDFILKDFVVVVKNLEGDFVAASQVCSHQQTEEVRFLEENGGIFRCSTHGARFDQQGTPLNSITPNPLKIFNVELTGSMLRVFE
ncbi:MAG: Rieske 2Fe-2S domain-containing protein [Bacteroidota bacterium]